MKGTYSTENTHVATRAEADFVEFHPTLMVILN